MHKGGPRIRTQITAWGVTTERRYIRLWNISGRFRERVKSSKYPKERGGTRVVATSGVSKLKRQGHLASVGGLGGDLGELEMRVEMKKILVGQWSGARGLTQ